MRTEPWFGPAYGHRPTRVSAACDRGRASSHAITARLVATIAPRRLRDALAACGVDSGHTWPRLSPAVRDGPDDATAQWLSGRVVTLPVYHHLEPARLEAAGRRLVDRY